jgi:hypothetical protein
MKKYSFKNMEIGGRAVILEIIKPTACLVIMLMRLFKVIRAK